MIDIRPYEGWRGMFTRNEAPEAYRNGTRVVKVKIEEGDAHPLGALATVLGSIHHPAVGIGYFVEWDEHPFHAVFVSGPKIEPKDKE